MRVMDVKWRRMEKGWDMIISLHFSDDKDNQLYHHISVKIPQTSPEGPEARAIQSPRACATRFPMMQSQGLLFVWPDENGWERARATKPPM
uniref:Uncharacterized protein n=1 Tax=Fagus sylvatica TaxID=28930 RepID=A0A2N9EY82_FAGSY